MAGARVWQRLQAHKGRQVRQERQVMVETTGVAHAEDVAGLWVCHGMRAWEGLQAVYVQPRVQNVDGAAGGA